MNSQTYDYWMSQGNYLPPHHTTVYELPPDVSKVPSLSHSPVSATYDNFSTQYNQAYYPQNSQIAEESVQFGTYALPLTPSDFGSELDSPYCSPRPLQPTEPAFAHETIVPPPERPHVTSGRRRAQNRAAQRAFRERKEKHARDLETQLKAMTEKYNKLELSHSELHAAYQKLRKSIELLTQDDDGENEGGNPLKRRSGLRKVLEILHGEFTDVRVKPETS